MKISAVDIRKHTFEKIFRGYDPDEVDAFLNSLSQEWERFSSENGLLKMQLEYAEKELSKLKDIESTLFRTLKSAEDASKLIEREANDQADKRMEESKKKADDMIAEAEERTSAIIKDTEERLKKFKDEFTAEVKVQERDFRAIENFRDNLIVQLSSLANNTIDTVDRFEQKYDRESVLNKMEDIKKHIAEIEIPRKPGYVPEVAEKEEEIVAAVPEEKPSVDFEVEDYEEEVIETVQPTKEQERYANTYQEPAEDFPVNVRRSVKTPADEANEALAEMHKAAEKARDESPAINKPRVQENNQPKKGGGGSFFDQI